MFSTTIKRSVATLGVVAGLLAAAVPASAMGVDGPDGDDVLAMNQTDWEFLAEAEGTQVGSEGVKDDQVKVSGYTYNPKEIGID